MLNGNIDVLELTGDISNVLSLEGNLLPIGPKGDKGDPGFSPVVTTSKSGKTTTIQFETATGNVYAYIQDGADGEGKGDMLTDVYDQNKNGIVDNAEKVNNHTVLTDVPANAVFTDTVYDDTEVRGLINDKPDFSDIPTKTSDLTNDSNFVTSNGNAQTTQTNVSSATITNTLEAPMDIDLKGNTLQNGTPTPSSPIPVNNVSGDNDIVVSDSANDTTTYNIDLPVENLFDKDTLEFKIGYYSSTGQYMTGANNGIMQFINVLPNTTYTISTNTTIREFVISEFNENTWLKRTSSPTNSSSFSITTGSTTNKLAIVFSKDNSTTMTKEIIVAWQPQLEKGSKPNTYTPYGTTPIELNKIGTYQDYIYKENDKWYLHKEVGKTTLNGSENWSFNNNLSTTTAYGLDQDIGIVATGSNSESAYTNYFVGIANGSATDSECFWINGSGRLRLRVKTSIAGNVSTFKTWLSNNNTIVYYQLATTTDTEITYTPLIEQLESIKNAMSKEGTTNVNQVNNDAPFILDLSVFNDNYNGRYESLLEMYKRLMETE